MAIKLTLAKAFALAKGFDYSGAEDAAAVKAFLTKTDGEAEIDGKVYDLKDIEIDAPAKKRVTIEAEAKVSESEAKANEAADALTKTISRLDAVLTKAAKGPEISVTGGQTIEQKSYERKIKDGKAVFGSVEEAELAADWLIGNHIAKNFPQMADLPMIERSRKAWTEKQSKGFGLTSAEGKDLSAKPGSGAVLVSQMFGSNIMRLVDAYGVLPQYAEVIDNIEGSYTDYKSDPSALRATYPTAASTTAATSADPTYSTVNLVPKQGIIRTRIFRELLASSRLGLADKVAQDLAWVYSYEVDQCGFNGAGATTEGGIYGIAGGFTAQDGYALTTIASGSNTDVAGSNAADTWGGYLIGHFHNAKRKLRGYAYSLYGGDVAWYCNQAFYDGVMVPLAISTSRALASEVYSGGNRMFLGLPVRFVEAMNRTADTSTDTPDCYLGNLRASVKYGRGKNADGGSGLELAMSEHRDFDINAISIRATFRHDVNFHDRGANSTTGTTGSLIVVWQT